MDYFKVTCKCGHVGRRNYIPIAFPIMASSGREASEKARRIPRVKHHHKYAILECKKISYEEYLKIMDQNDNDPYLRCKNKQDQRKISGLQRRIKKDFEFHEMKPKIDRFEKAKIIEYKRRKRSESDLQRLKESEITDD